MIAKTALVTGANGGLGTHVTKTLLDATFIVVGLAPKIQQSEFDHPNFIALPATLTSLETAKQAVATVIARCGKIAMLAHLVGGFAGGQTVAAMDDATWQHMLDANPASVPPLSEQLTLS
jgi:NAD(P)-dependent dehydrogenase (short-subunit alcohol dehydrogenase family)